MKQLICLLFQLSDKNFNIFELAMLFSVHNPKTGLCTHSVFDFTTDF